MSKLIFSYTILFLIFTSCNNHSNNQEKPPYILIDLENTINQQVSENFKLNDIATSLRLIPIETNDSVLLPYAVIRDVTDTDIVVSAKTAVYFISKTDGKVSSVIDKYGAGPGDYNDIGDVYINKKDHTLYLYDRNKKSINEYSFDGQFKKSIRNDSIGIFRTLKDGNFVVSYSPFVNSEFALGIYDSSGNIKRRGIPKINNLNFDMVYFDAILEFNNDFFYKLAHCDTLYRITSEYDEPYIVHSKGKFQIPLDIKSSREKTDREGYRYIQYDDGSLISNYYFLSYYYNNKLYSEIWDTENLSLIYKGTFGRDGGDPGVPIIIKEKKIHVWPAYVTDKTIYCLIENEDAVSLLPELPIDTNPIVLEINIPSKLN